jgi:peptidoglycan/LPS O-acetylase OafA/YrhL
MNSYPERQKERIDWIDSIRGLAAFLVMILHFFHMGLMALLPALMGKLDYIPTPAEHATLQNTMKFLAQQHLDAPFFTSLSNYVLGYWDLGRMGVALFFLVSGVVIPFSLSKADSPIRNFAISHFFRLYPIYWFSLIVLLLLNPSGLHYGWTTVAANFTMFQKFIGIQDINGVA